MMMMSVAMSMMTLGVRVMVMMVSRFRWLHCWLLFLKNFDWFNGFNLLNLFNLFGSSLCNYSWLRNNWGWSNRFCNSNWFWGLDSFCNNNWFWGLDRFCNNNWCWSLDRFRCFYLLSNHHWCWLLTWLSTLSCKFRLFSTLLRS